MLVDRATGGAGLISARLPWPGRKEAPDQFIIPTASQEALCSLIPIAGDFAIRETSASSESGAFTHSGFRRHQRRALLFARRSFHRTCFACLRRRPARSLESANIPYPHLPVFELYTSAPVRREACDAPTMVSPWTAVQPANHVSDREFQRRRCHV